ncbi:DNA segregation ATPase FtsK/SpoIIIE, S-DNA-T family [Atopostipes suicloacalis DSM 15692]|uniref:DNA segregation ATPase FtsK/SpoIIIE, S-DNA-T family n=1 Tax=Atopostipes suicloacalis DSM 15692 TaxID=1121025 RepID=A0A1M4TPU3_9LACT|nr:DNA translocase FtsK [Atopostipes suicloacalis]SHE46520.1 DNA segregation ATPase FtsK/SpoIIIE, S-DNA-T family [Atopostipes suicloacalis DSM 15692]
MSKKRKRGRKKKKGYSIEILGIIIVFISILAIGEFGFVGNFFANVIRIFVGDTFQLLAVLVGLLGLYYLFVGTNPKFNSHRLRGSILLFVALLVGLHQRVFAPIMDADVNIVQATWRNLMDLFSQTTNPKDIGGGMIGACLYAVSYFLFANIGTYIFLLLLVFFGVMSIGQFSYQNLFSKMGDGFKVMFNGLKKAFIKVKTTLQKNIQFETNEKDQKSKKSSKTKKTASVSNEEKTHEQEVKKRSAPVPIEGMKQTSLPIGDILPTENETENKTGIENDEPEEENGNLDINFVSDEENEDYKLPPYSLLDHHASPDQSNEYTIIEQNIKKLEETFESFGVEATVVKANLGPAVTKYEIQPATGVKVSRIVGLSDDIALALAAKDVRIEAPIPGKALIGIEVPNSEINIVYYNEVMSELNQTGADHPLDVPLGKDIGGNTAIANLSKMPHLLVAGATGSGKSVAINVIISSLLMRTRPHEVKLMLIDPKMVELNTYNGVPHLLTPVVTKPKKAARALQNVVEEMEKRYELFAMSGTRNIESYNEQVQLMKESGDENVPAKLPYIVVVVDELADLMMVAAKEVEDSIIRLAQMARAAGIHMILATQRPSVDVITGLIKANVPSRVAFATSSGTDSRTILDQNGAEKLLGRGDMLFLPMGANKTVRVQGAYISDSEVQAITDYVKNQQDPNYVEEMIPTDEPKVGNGQSDDEKYDEALEIVRELETASISLLQRRLRIGYNRAANIMDDLQANGIVSEQDGAKPRDVLIDSVEEEEEIMNHEDTQTE